MLFALSLLAAAHAGDLEVAVTVDDETTEFRFHDVASCMQTTAAISGEDSWEVRAWATGTEAGAIYVELDLDVELERGRERRRVQMGPAVLTPSGEPATVQIDGEVGVVTVEITATDFATDLSCMRPASAQRRGRRRR